MHPNAPPSLSHNWQQRAAELGAAAEAEEAEVRVVVVPALLAALAEAEAAVEEAVEEERRSEAGTKAVRGEGRRRGLVLPSAVASLPDDTRRRGARW